MVTSLRNIINPVLERLFTVLPACSEFKKSLVVILLPLSLDALGGSSSLHYPYAVSYQKSIGNFDRSISGSVGSNTIKLLLFAFRISNM